MEFTQFTENDAAELILCHEPRYEIFMSMLHPAASLYMDVTSEVEVKTCFENFREILKEQNIKLLTVRECMKMEREGLVKLAYSSLSYECKNMEEGKENPEFLYFISNDYKKSVVEKLSDEQLVDVILTRPNYEVKYVSRNTYVEPVNISFRPLGNLLFVRDQQITTQKGVVIGKTMAYARELEHDIMLQVFKNLGVKVIGEVPNNAYLEGGDFFVAKTDLSIMGVGMRTNFEAAAFLMSNDLLGTDRFALAIDENDFTQQRMHLDTFFNIINPKNVLVLDFEELTKYYGRKINRRIDIYVKKSSQAYNKDSPHKSDQTYGEYTLNKSYDDFYSFLTDEGYNIIKCSHEQQSDFVINFLNIGNDTIIAVNPQLKEMLEKANVEVKVIDLKFDAIVKMFGAVHCATQVARRRPTFK